LAEYLKADKLTAALRIAAEPTADSDSVFNERI